MSGLLEIRKMDGYLSKKDIKKLRDASLRRASPHRNSTYSTWVCVGCSHSCFFKTIKCQICGEDTKEVKRETNYLFKEEVV